MKELTKYSFTPWIALPVLALIQKWGYRDRKISIGCVSRITNCDRGLRGTFRDDVLAFNLQLGDESCGGDGTTIGQPCTGKPCSIAPISTIRCPWS